MTTDYERERELRILKNRELLNGLSLAKATRLQKSTVSTVSRPKNRRKVDSLPPTRTSSRLSNQARPSYVYEDVIKESPAKRIRRGVSVVTPSSETREQDIVERWSWQPTADVPTRDVTGTLSFNDYPDVHVSNSSKLNIVSPKSYS
jgi:hypothetical protein